MQTAQLIAMLATGVEPVRPQLLQRRYVRVLSWALTLTAAVMLAVLGLRPDIQQAAWLLMFWAKLAFTTALLIGAAAAVICISRPGGRVGKAATILAAPVVAVWLISGFELLNAPSHELPRLIYGDSWAVCPVTIAALSALLFVAIIWTMRGFAPTRLTLAGGAAGLLAGAGAATIYALHCCEMSMPFIGIWYVIGMMIPAVVGAVIGPRVLRW